MAVQLTRKRFTSDEFYRMIATGIVREGDRLELLDGEIVEMAAIGVQHAGMVNRLNRVFNRRFGDAAVVCVQNPIDLGARSQPQPDIVLARPRSDLYRHSHPRPVEVLLVVEVCDSSLEYDRQVKLPIYARADVSEVWLADLHGDQILVHREPAADGYQVVRSVRRGERLAPLAFPDIEFAVNDLLG